MKIAIVGGIYGMSEEFRRVNLQETTETLLEEGMRERGHEVTTYGHHDLIPTRQHDLLHIHHLGRACVQMIAKRRLPLVFSRHATKELPRHEQLILDLTYRRADRVIAASDWERRAMESQGVDPHKIRRLYNGVRQDHFRPLLRSAPATGEPWRLLVVGQLIELKRTHLAIELVAGLRGQGVPAVVDIAYQRDTLLDELRRRTRDLGVEDAVHFRGPLGREELGEAIGRSHLLVHPSRSEALPTVVTEAALSALPVLAFDVGGIREQVADQRLILDVAQTAELLPTAQRLLSTYPASARASMEHASIAQAQFDVEAMIDAQEQIYGEIVGSRARRR